ncbi:MAG TPA: ATPase domain-containing protein [Thermomicrobiales bacterium]|nr:ATPase domain-containing protein [Thermomicrobiales bacterium]
MSTHDGEHTAHPWTAQRVTTGVSGFDEVLDGGLLEGASCLISGGPGTGKTTLGNQIAYHLAADDVNVLFVTVMAEAHDCMLMHIANFGFFRAELVGHRVHYVSLVHQLAENGVSGAIQELRRMVHTYDAKLLVIDGIARCEDFAPSRAAYRSFVSELVAQMAAYRCSTLLLAQPDSESRTLHDIGTIVDDIVLLEDVSLGVHDTRLLRMLKMRGAVPLRGQHEFVINHAGIDVYPRLEARPLAIQPARPMHQKRLPVGIDGLDSLLQGGLLTGSSTLIAGPPGIGKTTLGLHFIAEGAHRGTPGMIASFGEAPERLTSRATGFGLELERHVASGAVRILWQPTSDLPLDAWANQLLAAVVEHRPQRLFIDGLTGLVRLASFPDRLPGFLSALGNALRAEGIATIISVETPTVEDAELDIPLPEAVATLDNVVLLRYVEPRSRLHRLISVLRVRESGFDPGIREFTITDRGIEVASSSASAASVLGDDTNLPPSPPKSGEHDAAGGTSNNDGQTTDHPGGG